MKYYLCFLIMLCCENVSWGNDAYYYVPAPTVYYQQPVTYQPCYTFKYVPVVKQEIVMIPVVENGFFYYYPSSRWVSQPAPWSADPYSEWLRCRHSNYRY